MDPEIFKGGRERGSQVLQRGKKLLIRCILAGSPPCDLDNNAYT